jgi:hypothetical protein
MDRDINRDMGDRCRGIGKHKDKALHNYNRKKGDTGSSDNRDSSGVDNKGRGDA